MIATVGLAVFTGFTGLFSLGHAAFFAIGAYTAAILTYFYGWNFYLALAAGGGRGLVGFVIGYPHPEGQAAHRLFRHRHPGLRGGRPGAAGEPAHHPGRPGPAGIRATPPSPCCWWSATGHLGRLEPHPLPPRAPAIAIREDFVAAEMMGVDVFMGRLRSLTFSAACAGLAGGLFAHYFCFIQPSMFTAYMSTQMTAAVVAGGMGSISGPLIAALIFIGIPEALRVANMWRWWPTALLLVLIMVFRPRG